ncbi:photosynthetic NDH subunit of subcomplex B 3, chloroplastic [Magnolia sinica]|uniref:photosynthetic NDH subunit of subcomplex B 3, chloroplastic n=1 Tax=Magnolia sinica TaxID=86752 RepID=UPI002657BF35|nr:photosynthetic NDH subunit of subcomplex B 3, chloroplastic [Magnolia sinica]
MAAVHLSLASLQQPATIPSSASARNPRKPFSFPSISRKHRTISISRAVADSSNSSPSGTEAAPPQKPEIELEFLGPKPGVDGSFPVERASAVSGEKLLRNIMLDNKMELYATYGKVMNCGGGGSCGTCIVEILDGKDLLNERTNTELRYLKKKPDSWRLACQTIVGNKENSGKVVVQRLPQWKK